MADNEHEGVDPEVAELRRQGDETTNESLEAYVGAPSASRTFNTLLFALQFTQPGLDSSSPSPCRFLIP